MGLWAARTKQAFCDVLRFRIMNAGIKTAEGVSLLIEIVNDRHSLNVGGPQIGTGYHCQAAPDDH